MPHVDEFDLSYSIREQLDKTEEIDTLSSEISELKSQLKDLQDVINIMPGGPEALQQIEFNKQQIEALRKAKEEQKRIQATQQAEYKRQQQAAKQALLAQQQRCLQQQVHPTYCGHMYQAPVVQQGHFANQQCSQKSGFRKFFGR